jgi:hypothetical protein
MRRALAAEFGKLFSTRLWWFLLICAAGYLALMGASMAAMVHLAASDFPADPAAAAPLVYSLAGSFAYVFPLLVGALAVTQEYRHQTITPTFLAEPRRGRVLAAKLLVSLPMGLVYGLACVAATALPAAAVFAATGIETGLGSGQTWEQFGRALIDFALWAPIGVGVGSLIHSQAAAIVGVLAVTQFVEPTLRVLPEMTGLSMPWVKFLPGAAGDAIQGASFYDSLAAGPAAEPLAWGWGAVFAALGYVFTWRRDVT